jgi:hypothetical protein
MNETEQKQTKAGYHLCPCCQVEAVLDKYDLCYVCEARWRFVFKRAKGEGCSTDEAMKRANEAYPHRGKH